MGHLHCLCKFYRVRSIASRCLGGGSSSNILSGPVSSAFMVPSSLMWLPGGADIKSKLLALAVLAPAAPDSSSNGSKPPQVVLQTLFLDLPKVSSSGAEHVKEGVAEETERLCTHNPHNSHLQGRKSWLYSLEIALCLFSGVVIGRRILRGHLLWRALPCPLSPLRARIRVGTRPWFWCGERTSLRVSSPASILFDDPESLSDQESQDMLPSGDSEFESLPPRA